MGKIDLRRFVNVNIKNHSSSIISGTRDEIVLLTSEGSGNAFDAESYKDLQTGTASWASKTKTLAYGDIYFKEGGVKLHVIPGKDLSTNEGAMTDEQLKTLVTGLDDKYICITYASNDSDRVSAYTKLKTLATSLASDTTIYGINEKMIVAGIKLTDSTTVGEQSALIYTIANNVKNFALKVSSTIGAEMTIAAYLSKINAYGADCIYDYNFTRESIDPEDISDTVFGTIQTNNINVNILLANESTNCGGNCGSGDLVNEYTRIVLHQTCTDRLIALLQQKIKSTNGLGKIYTTLVEELNRYLVSGYLTTDKIWTDNDFVISYNNQNFTLIEKGTALINGYLIKIIPFSAISSDDKTTKSTPPIYIFIASQYGIRKITINGEII